MEIEQLEVTGFRSLRDVQWRPGRVNVIIGPNGSGKSNLLQVAELLHKAAIGELGATILKLGGLLPLLWDERVGDFTFRLRAQGRSVRYVLGLRQIGDTGAYRIVREDLEVSSGSVLVRAPAPKFLDREGSWLESSEDAVGERESLLYLAASPVVGNADIMDFQSYLESWSIYHDLRVDRDAPLRHAAVARYEKQIDADGQNLIPVLHTLYTGNRDFESAVDNAMRAAFGADYEKLVFPPAADQRVQLRVRWRSLKTEQSAANLSDGILRFLLLLAILANPEPGDLIAIDEPETGLHPGIFPILAELAAQAAEKTQVVFTTHSPQFLDAFSEPPTTTVCEWAEGTTRLSVLDGEELARWLQHYSLGAMFRSGELEALA